MKKLEKGWGSREGEGEREVLKMVLKSRSKRGRRRRSTFPL